MDFKTEIKSQYHASLQMLQQAVAGCPAELWQRPQDKNPYWQVAFHGLFYTHFYLHPTMEDFTPWPKHRDEVTSLGEGQTATPYTQAELLEYIDYFRERIDEMVDQLDLSGPSGFHWLPFNKFELQFYNIRHLMQHTGELAERLWAEAGIEVKWVGMRK